MAMTDGQTRGMGGSWPGRGKEGPKGGVPGGPKPKTDCAASEELVFLRQLALVFVFLLSFCKDATLPVVGRTFASSKLRALAPPPKGDQRGPSQPCCGQKSGRTAQEEDGLLPSCVPPTAAGIPYRPTTRSPPLRKRSSVSTSNGRTLVRLPILLAVT